MKVELKNAKTHRGHDGIGLNADILVDGKKIAHVYDGAYGGCYEYTPIGKTTDEIKANRAIIEKLEEYAKKVTDAKFEALDSLVDQLFNEQEKKNAPKKLLKKLEKQMVKAILVGTPIETADGSNYSYAIFDLKRPVSSVPLPQLQSLIDRIKATKLKEGEQILNTNLKQLGINF